MHDAHITTLSGRILSVSLPAGVILVLESGQDDEGDNSFDGFQAVVDFYCDRLGFTPVAITTADAYKNFVQSKSVYMQYKILRLTEEEQKTFFTYRQVEQHRSNANIHPVPAGTYQVGHSDLATTNLGAEWHITNSSELYSELHLSESLKVTKEGVYYRGEFVPDAHGVYEHLLNLLKLKK